MLVIGIDPGTASTGFGLVEERPNRDLAVVEFGVIKTSAQMSMPERLAILYEGLTDLLAKHRPIEAAVEKLYFQKNVRTAISVAQGRGVALLALARAQVAVAEYTPLEVKQAVAGYGAAAKGQIQQMVRTLLQLDEIPKPDDAADALAIAICHLSSMRTRTLYREAG